MNTRITNMFLVPALMAGLGLILPGRATAQTFTTLHSFAGYPSDGADPQAGLILSGGTLYGTAYSGRNFNPGFGTVFAVNTNGTGFTNLYNFTDSSDGAYPRAGLILSSNILYGTAYQGGTVTRGTVFAVNTSGTSFTPLHSFAGYPSDGASPQAGLILASNTLYGTTLQGDFYRAGTLFAINTNGLGFKILYIFTGGGDGAYPQAGLVLASNILYGTAQNGGSAGNGVVFAFNTNGPSLTVVHNFTALSNATNSDGANPLAGLILSGNTLYGTASVGGSGGNGTVFAVNTNGTGITNLHSFTVAHTNSLGPYTNSDGANPQAGLILSGNTLYGTAANAGDSGAGTVFAVNTDGTGFTNLHNFAAINLSNGTNSEGAIPQAALILSGNTLYGTATAGGTVGKGTVFSLSLGSVSVSAPQLTINRSGTNVILTWPTNVAGFILQYAPAVTGSFTNLPSATSPYTSSITGAQKFYRLSQ
jgi:uncharacterized repeat protein (TIGR03803 family)